MFKKLITLAAILMTLTVKAEVWDHVPDYVPEYAPEYAAEEIIFGFNVKADTDDWRKSEKILEALELIRRVFASEEFKERIIEHELDGRRTFADNQGKTNRQIYKSILAGAETLAPEENSMMDMELEFYSEDSNVVGYTYPSSPRVWINTKFFDAFRPEQVAANIVHEWLHKLGYGHEHEWTPTRRYSVPYAIGRMVRELAAELPEDQ